VSRLERRFADLKAEGRSGLVVFITAGDPDLESSWSLLDALPAAGADVVELGMPFSDPMADGPAIQASSLRALKAGMTLKKTLALAARFRTAHPATPLILMGYYNPIFSMGVKSFVSAAVEAGVDGLIIVDLPPEEDSELCVPARQAGLHWIRLATPTSDTARLPKLLGNASGFLYYVSVLGITGTRSADQAQVAAAVGRLRQATSLPIAVGFGIKTPAQAAAVGAYADAAVVGSAVIDKVRAALDDKGHAKPQLVQEVTGFVKSLSAALAGKVGALP
jgi:tryptophan synthase alpha chain